MEGLLLGTKRGYGFTSPYRFDRTKDGGGILVHIREDIISKLLNISFIASDIECLGIEVNLRKASFKPFRESKY